MRKRNQIPYDNDSDIHEFSIFMINMFQACESGSCGGDAYVSIIYVKLMVHVIMVHEPFSLICCHSCVI